MILDANVIVKLVIYEPGSDRAHDVVVGAVERGDELSVPDIALAEALNALWKHHKLLGELDEDAYYGAVKDALRLWEVLDVHESGELAPRACRIASTAGITVYDSLYLALAERLGSELFSFDKEMIRAARELGIRVIVR